MKVSYRREMKHNYMILEPESPDLCRYLCQMLDSNAIEGLLRFQMRQMNGEVLFYYEITSRQPLARLLENQPVKYDQIRSLVLGIAGALSQMERYLLPESCVLLEPEYIYVEPEQFRVWLCLVPGISRDFPEDCSRLLEYLLGKVDHQDKESVLLAYGMYQESRKQNYGLEDLLKQLENRGKEPLPETGKGAETEAETGERRPAEAEREKSPLMNARMSRQREEALPWSRFAGWWKRRGTKEPEVPVQVPWEMMFYEENEVTPAPESIQPGPDTVLLTDLSAAEAEQSRRLHPLNGTDEEIVLAYFPFIIGKQENMVDYLLQKETVSRLHLRIDREGEQYFVRDLNSTNGTVVSGYLLEANEAVEVHPGEEICIAGFRYRFE